MYTYSGTLFIRAFGYSTLPEYTNNTDNVSKYMFYYKFQIFFDLYYVLVKPSKFLLTSCFSNENI